MGEMKTGGGKVKGRKGENLADGGQERHRVRVVGHRPVAEVTGHHGRDCSSHFDVAS